MTSIDDILSRIKSTEDSIEATLMLLRVHQDNLFNLRSELKKLMPLNPIYTLYKHLVQKNWPFMRVKNTIKYLRLGSTRISHYDGLKLLADKKNIDIQTLLNMSVKKYTGSDHDAICITEGMWSHRNYYYA